MANFLFIHGAAHGAWCWSRVLPLLADHGHQAQAIDLPGHGQDRTPRKVITMQNYVDAVMDALPENCVLVGHSFGGFPITLAAARQPERVASLVYVAALLPRPGRSFRDFRAEAINPEVSETQTVDREAGEATVIRDRAAPLYYSNCTEVDRAFALARLTPQPIGVMTETLDFRMPDTRRYYVRCAEDRVVFPDYQATVAAECDKAFDLPSGHSPFLSHPDALADVLDRIANLN
ncbi:MAG: alpha/beta fold hydrolase [Paracoccaceae bacterium]|nr:alpha/beta fold hydrolase [Paracoccaceae bacterium]